MRAVIRATTLGFHRFHKKFVSAGVARARTTGAPAGFIHTLRRKHSVKGIRHADSLVHRHVVICFGHAVVFGCAAPGQECLITGVARRRLTDIATSGRRPYRRLWLPTAKGPPRAGSFFCHQWPLSALALGKSHFSLVVSCRDKCAKVVRCSV